MNEELLQISENKYIVSDEKGKISLVETSTDLYDTMYILEMENSLENLQADLTEAKKVSYGSKIQKDILKGQIESLDKRWKNKLMIMLIDIPVIILNDILLVKILFAIAALLNGISFSLELSSLKKKQKELEKLESNLFLLDEKISELFSKVKNKSEFLDSNKKKVLFEKKTSDFEVKDLGSSKNINRGVVYKKRILEK